MIASILFQQLVYETARLIVAPTRSVLDGVRRVRDLLFSASVPFIPYLERYYHGVKTSYDGLSSSPETEAVTF